MRTHRFEKLDPRILLHGDTTSGGSYESQAQEAEVSIVVADPLGEIHGTNIQASSHHSGHGGENPHTDDPVLAGEHDALLNLVPHSQVTHRAAANGAWSAPETWENSAVPNGMSHVLIPHGLTVQVDGEFAARIGTIRVDGTLNFATDVDTQLVVDTFVVAIGGTLNIGTGEQPIAADVTANILFTDDGPIDTTWDPRLLSRGLISHGSATIFGAAKTGPVDLAVAPEAGDTTLQLESAVVGWQVGDRVLVPGVIRPLENNKGVTQYDHDEIVTITAISPDGLSIDFDQPLQYDHVPPRLGLDVPVSNLDRNVKFSSENTTDPQRAGHVMFMHSPDAMVSFASFNHIGRTDKNLVTTDPQLDESGVLVPGTGDNARGRYAVHFHRMGSESSVANVHGSVVENSPGWGFVNHDSNAIFSQNTSYNVKGAGFVTEVGSERGAFISNFAVRSRGKNFYQPVGASDKGEGTGFGSVGHGFWLQSASVALIDNVAAGHAQEGIFIHSRSVTEPGRDLPTYTSLVDTPVGTPLEFTANASEPAIRGAEIRTDQAAMAEMSGNKVFASGAGLAFRWRRQSDAVLEGTNGDVFENFQIWNVEWAGIHLGYTTGLMLTDGLILGNVDNPISLSNRELDDRASEPSEFHTSVGKGIVANRNSKNLVFRNLEIAGFTVGIQALTQSKTRIDTVLLQNVEDLVIVTPQATEQSGHVRRINATNVFHAPLSQEALEGATQYKVRLMKQIVRSPVAGGSSASQEWASFTASDEIYYNGHRLYFHDQAEERVPFPSADVPGFMSNSPYSQYVDLTNQELMEDFGLALGGAAAPEEAFDAADSLGIDGLAVALTTPAPLPERVEFGVDEEMNPTTWNLGDEDLQITWRSKGISETTQWRVYLSNENGNQEIGRTGVAEEYGHVVQSTAGATQTWNFNWPTVGTLPQQWSGLVQAGDHSLIVVADGSPAVYLGRVTIAAQATPTNVGQFIPTAGELPAETSVPTDTSNDEPTTDLSADEQTPIANVARTQTARPASRSQMVRSARATYRPEIRLSPEQIEEVFASEENLLNGLK